MGCRVCWSISGVSLPSTRMRKTLPLIDRRGKQSHDVVGEVLVDHGTGLHLCLHGSRSPGLPYGYDVAHRRLAPSDSDGVERYAVYSWGDDFPVLDAVVDHGLAGPPVGEVPVLVADDVATELTHVGDGDGS